MRKAGKGRLQYRFESLAGSLQELGHTAVLPDGSDSTMLIRFACLLAVLPVSMAAEFDKCARASPVWAGVDQVHLCVGALPARQTP